MKAQFKMFPTTVSVFFSIYPLFSIFYSVTLSVLLYSGHTLLIFLPVPS